jgi:hypothetical protein
MEIEAMKKHYAFLKALHSEFRQHYLVYTKGTKKANRNQAQYDVELNLMEFEDYWQKYPELSDYFFSVSGSGHRANYLNELNSINYFGKDMSRILKSMESEIRKSEKVDNE